MLKIMLWKWVKTAEKKLLDNKEEKRKKYDPLSFAVRTRRIVHENIIFNVVLVLSMIEWK